MSGLLLLVAGAGLALASAGEPCGDGGLLPCLEAGLVRRAEELLDRDNIPLGAGLELHRTGGSGAAPGEEGLGRFLEQRSVVWNLSEATDTLAGLLPSDGSEEARGKKKKLLRALLPILVAVKMKVIGFLILAYIAIALIAKKALLSSLISLAVSGFIAIRKLMSGGGAGHPMPTHHEVYESGHGWGGGWEDSQGAYSSNVIAYQAHKPLARYSDKSI